jgi:hypothetical protein
MKNQYFGDINDYRKYGLLRILAGSSKMKVAICWMLTNNDNRSDGNFVNYLTDPERWQKYDPALFDMLTSCEIGQTDRSVKSAEEKLLIPSAVYFSDLIPQKKSEREEYFQNFRKLSSASDIIFFDPDNGVEVKSVSYGRKNSQKYIYWKELIETFDAGKSVLFYQHFRRIKRDLLTTHLVNQIFLEFRATDVITFSTANVLFLLIPQVRHKTNLSERSQKVAETWKTQIKVQMHELK